MHSLIHQDMIKCITEAEKRILQHTVNQVSSEYAHVHIMVLTQNDQIPCKNFQGGIFLSVSLPVHIRCTHI